MQTSSIKFDKVPKSYYYLLKRFGNFDSSATYFLFQRQSCDSAGNVSLKFTVASWKDILHLAPEW